ncbi:MAG TPA: hypothetical protein PK961_05985 [bacterium]|nr:hypothetical protein [bacterium]
MNKRWLFFFIVSITALFLSGAIHAALSPADDYRAERAKLTGADRATRLGADLFLNKKEQVVDEYLTALRSRINNDYLKKNDFPPAKMFYQVKTQIEEDLIFELLKTMPKGGALHVHTSASGTAEWIVDTALQTPDTYLCWQDKCHYWDGDDYPKGTLVVARNRPRGFITIAEAKKVENLREELIRMLTIGLEEDALPDIWVEFENIFNRAGNFLNYKPVFEKYFHHAMTILAEDNVQYLEYRGGMSPYEDLSGKKYTAQDMITTLRDIAHQVAKEYPGFKMKLILAAHRSATSEKVTEKLATATRLYQDKALRDEGHPFIIGFDLVGQEDNGYKTIDYLDVWLKARREGNDIPFYFHDGESAWFFDDNLYDTVIDPIASRRIGHGFNLFRFPSVLEKVKEKDIALEICPISNQVLRYVGDLRLHPGAEYINRGEPVVLSSDDPSIFGYRGLTYDFWAAYMAWGFDLRTLKKLALNSLTYTGMDQQEKTEAIAQWQRKWNTWIETVYAQAKK